MKRSLCMICAVLAFAGLTTSASAVDLALWQFETSQPVGTDSQTPTNAPLAAEGGVNAGAGSPGTGFHSSTATDWSNPAGNGSVDSFSVNTWSSGDYFQFSTSTTGFTSIAISWDQTRSSTGPDDFTLLYSLDNVIYTALTSYVVLLNDAANGGVWSSGGSRISNYLLGPVAGPASLDNQPAVYFRMRADEAGSAVAGTGRVDNVLITGVPEPTSLALMLIGGFVALRRRR